jgi:hypothetical protein
MRAPAFFRLAALSLLVPCGQAGMAQSIDLSPCDGAFEETRQHAIAHFQREISLESSARELRRLKAELDKVRSMSGRAYAATAGGQAEPDRLERQLLQLSLQDARDRSRYTKEKLRALQAGNVAHYIQLHGVAPIDEFDVSVHKAMRKEELCGYLARISQLSGMAIPAADLQWVQPTPGTSWQAAAEPATSAPPPLAEASPARQQPSPAGWVLPRVTVPIPRGSSF